MLQYYNCSFQIEALECSQHREENYTSSSYLLSIKRGSLKRCNIHWENRIWFYTKTSWSRSSGLPQPYLPSWVVLHMHILVLWTTFAIGRNAFHYYKSDVREPKTISKPEIVIVINVENCFSMSSLIKIIHWALNKKRVGWSFSLFQINYFLPYSQFVPFNQAIL